MSEILQSAKQETIASRIGQAFLNHGAALSGAISFKAGCAVIAPMFGDLLQSPGLVMTVISEIPPIILHVEWLRGESERIIDSRELGFDDAIPDICARPPSWAIDYPDRLRLELRSYVPYSADTGGLETLSTLILPYLELSRRTDRLSRALSILEVALTPTVSRNSNDTSGEIVKRIGHLVSAPTAFFPVLTSEQMPGDDPVHIFPGYLAEHVSQHMFASFGRIPEGPVQRALRSPAGAAPTTRVSIGDEDAANRLNAMLARLNITDYLAIRVVHEDHPIGVVACVLTTTGGTRMRFSGDEVARVASAAFIAGWAIPLAEQQAHLRRLLLESEMLRHLVQVSFQHKNRDETLITASNVARIIFGADYVGIGTISSRGELRGFRYVSGNRTEAHQRVTYTFASSSVRNWLEQPNLIVLENLGERSNFQAEEFPILRQEQLQTVIISPFELQDGSWVVLMIGFRSNQRVTEHDSRFAQSLAQTIAAAIP